MGVSKSAISRVVGVDVEYVNFNAGKTQFLPQRLAIIGIGNNEASYSLDKYEVLSADATGRRFGYGSPLHLAARQLFPSSGNSAVFPVTIYPLKTAETAQSATATASITGAATGNSTGKITAGGISAEFTIKKGDNPTTVLKAIEQAVNAIIDMPIAAEAGETFSLTSKWSGEIGNRIKIKFDITDPGLLVQFSSILSGGTGDPDVQSALDKIGNVWETVILNTFDYTKTSRLDQFFEFGIGRWSVLNKRPCLVVHGCTDDFETRTAITDARKNDYINFLSVSVGSVELPFVIAAKSLVNDIITTANDNPPCGYKGLLTGLHTGSDDKQEDYTARNAAVQKGSSTNIVNGGYAELNDVVTFYHPENEGKYPSKRYVCDLVKLQNVVYNVRLIMESDEIKAAVLVSDKTTTSNPRAIQPKIVKTQFINLADSLADAAIIQEPKFTKAGLQVAVDSENPKRLNVKFPVKLSGNAEVVSVDILFGFYLGGN